ncbi:MAG: DUF6577 family protein [Bacteriovoracaceae bacterium]
MNKNDLVNTFKIIKSKFGHTVFTVQDLGQVLKEIEPNLLLSTLRWRIFALKQDGSIMSVSRGAYVISKKQISLNISLSPVLKKIAKEIKMKFPYARFCLWSTEILNSLSIHQVTKNYILVEVEKNVVESVFSFLQENHKNVFINPNEKEIISYIISKDNPIIVKNLTFSAPIEVKSNEAYITPKIEKILVDLLAEPNVFFIYQNGELETIWRQALSQYHINLSTLISYAKRRQKEKDVMRLLEGLDYRYMKKSPTV